MTMEKTTLPGHYHNAIERWRDTFLPDYQLLLDHWEKFFPHEPRFELCAYRDCNMCGTIEVGDDKGKPKFTRAQDMDEKRAGHILKAIRAQASTEFGSIQQHQLTLTRAQNEQDQFWVLRMMAEELRHGYQMCSLLLSDDWKSVAPESGEDMVEEILSMKTGSHVLGAFNVDFDSFVDNIVFCALIDRVGKYQLSMQKVSAYEPMAASMPQMLREEAFHLATGVVPMRRWIEQAALGTGHVSMALIQKTLHKWFPRALDMFGDERGGGTNVRFGFKPMNNDQAMSEYIDEVSKLVADLNLRFVRARHPKLGRDEANAVVTRVVGAGETVDGITPQDLLRLPDRKFFRRRGMWAFELNDIDGNAVADYETYRTHLLAQLNETYPAGRDLGGYLDLIKQVAAGELSAHEASLRLPNLRRVGGVCPCSRSVQWVTGDESQSSDMG